MDLETVSPADFGASLRGFGLNLLVRYSHGLVDVARPVDEQPFPQAPFPPEAHTRTVSVMLLLGL